MKKIYSIVIALFLFTTITKAQTCSIDPVFQAMHKAGIWPDSATNFISGTVGQPYFQNITVAVPYDTNTTQLGLVKFCKIRVGSVTGLPPGLSFSCKAANGAVNTTGCDYAGAATAGTFNYDCAKIAGTPTTAGTYTLSIDLKIYVGNNGLACAVPATTSTLTYYKIVISPSLGISKMEQIKIADLKNVPNPFDTKTVIKFNAPDNDNATFKVFSLIGKQVMDKKVEVVKGENEIEFFAKDLPSGVYLYSISYKGNTITKRMIIAND